MPVTHAKGMLTIDFGTVVVQLSVPWSRWRLGWRYHPREQRRAVLCCHLGPVHLWFWNRDLVRKSAERAERRLP